MLQRTLYMLCSVIDLLWGIRGMLCDTCNMLRRLLLEVAGCAGELSNIAVGVNVWLRVDGSA